MRSSWEGAVALVLAVAIGVGWVATVVVVVSHPKDLSASGAVVVYGFGATLFGGVVGWLTARSKEREDDDERPGP